jgi:hypothetical protein
LCNRRRDGGEHQQGSGDETNGRQAMGHVLNLKI